MMSRTEHSEASTLRVQNFGPIVEADVQLRPLTVFVGPSNVGKSYLATLIYALHRVFDASFPSDAGHGSRLGSVRLLGIHHKIDTSTKRMLHRWMEQCDDESNAIHITDSIYQLFLPDLVRHGNYLQKEISRCFGTDVSSLIRRSSDTGTRILLGNHVSAGSESGNDSNIEFTIEKNSKISTSFPESAAFPIQGESAQEYMRSIKETYSIYDRKDQGLGDLLSDLLYLSASSLFGNALLRPAFYLPAGRTGIMQAYRIIIGASVERATFTGVHNDSAVPMLSGVLADLLQSLIRLDQHAVESHAKLHEILEDGVLDGAITLEFSESGLPLLYYQPSGWREQIPLMNTSSMVSELAPLAIYLRHIVREGDVLVIEEPESHLHPAKQTQLIRQLASIVNSGIRVIITTHSEWILEELANLVRMSDLDETQRGGLSSADYALNAKDVGVWLFKQKKRPKGSTVVEIPLDVDMGLFPADYSNVAMTLHNDWAEINSRIDRSHDKS